MSYPMLVAMNAILAENNFSICNNFEYIMRTGEVVIGVVNPMLNTAVDSIACNFLRAQGGMLNMGVATSDLVTLPNGYFGFQIINCVGWLWYACV